MKTRQSSDLKFIRSFIKKQLRLKKWNYRKLAESLDVSEATVKRWLSQSDLSVTQLIQIGRVLDFNLIELTQAEFSDPKQFGFYSLSQENFLSHNPLAFYIFIKLAFGFSIKEVMKITSLTESELRKNLRSLEKVKLLELWPGDKIRLRLNGPYRIRPESEFAKKVSRKLKDVIMQHFNLKFNQRVEVPKSQSCTVFRPTELHLSRESAHQLSCELMNLLTKYATLSGIEAQNNVKLDPISILIGVDEFDAWLEVALRS